MFDTCTQHTDYWEEGIIRESGPMKNGVRHGEFHFYRSDGSLWWIINFIDGDRIGYAALHSEGTVQSGYYLKSPFRYPVFYAESGLIKIGCHTFNKENWLLNFDKIKQRHNKAFDFQITDEDIVSIKKVILFHEEFIGLPVDERLL